MISQYTIKYECDDRYVRNRLYNQLSDAGFDVESGESDGFFDVIATTSEFSNFQAIRSIMVKHV